MIIIEELEEKHPWENPKYELDLSKNTAFSEQGEAMDQNPTWYIWDTDDFTVNLAPSMITNSDYDANANIVMCDIGGGTNGKTYLLLAAVEISATSRKYVALGRLKVKSHGVTL